MVAGTLSMQGIVQSQLERGHLVHLRQLRLHGRAVRAVHHRGDGGNQSRAVRSAGSRIGTGRRLPHRVQRLPLGALFPGRVRQYFRGVERRGDAVLGRLAASLPEREWLETPLNYGTPVLLFVGSGLLTFPLIKKLRDPMQQKVLLGVVVLLVAIGAIMAIPMVNTAIIGLFWFLVKVSVIVYMMIWFRGTFPRYRYDQLMNIGWKVAIPIGMVVRDGERDAGDAVAFGFVFRRVVANKGVLGFVLHFLCAGRDVGDLRFEYHFQGYHSRRVGLAARAGKLLKAGRK